MLMLETKENKYFVYSVVKLLSHAPKSFIYNHINGSIELKSLTPQINPSDLKFCSTYM